MPDSPVRTSLAATAAILMITSISCKNPDGSPEPEQSLADTTRVYRPESIPDRRDSVAADPVAVYAERTDNPLNNWYFRVQLYETPRTFYYRMKLEFEEIRGDDTIKLPNFGAWPRPVIQKGPGKYACIIGFLDKDSVFREFKKVYVEGDQLKVTTLKHYHVYSIPRKKEN